MFAEQTPAGREATKILARADALMNRLENSEVDSPKSGYAVNAYGYYYKTATFEKMLALVEEAEALSHLDGACAYSRAGFHQWAGNFERSAELYAQVVESWPQYAQSARTMLATALGRLGRLAEAQRVIDEHNRVLAENPMPGMPLLDFRRIGISTA